MVELLNIPEETLKDLDTEQIVSIVMDYPFLGDIYAFNSVEDGINVVSGRFSGLRELFGREDAGDGLYKKYKAIEQEITGLTDINNVNYKSIMNEMILTTLLSQPNIFNQLDEEQVSSIIKSSNAMSEKLELMPIYSYSNSPFLDSLEETQAIPSTVYTPKGTAVSVMIRGEELTSAQKQAMNSYMASAYPNATRLRTATTHYNCHSYAWYSLSSNNIYWMNNPAAYMSDGSYVRVGSLPTAAGQVFYYPVTGGHSALVFSTSSNIWNVTLTSKWGSYGLYRHNYGHDPYGHGALNVSSWRRS